MKLKYSLASMFLLAAASFGFSQSPAFTKYPAKTEKIGNINVDLSSRNPNVSHQPAKRGKRWR